MSWQIFKNNILRVANDPISIRNTEQVANLYAMEYDSAIRRGADILHNVSILSGNLPMMIQLFNLALKQGLNTNSPQFSLVNSMGNGVISYWSGATMNVVPIPLMPAPGTIQNILVTSNIVSNPGTWSVYPPIPPTNSTSIIIDTFIAAATLHLTTITGLINTLSLYPAAPSPIPGPAIIPWTGYRVL